MALVADCSLAAASLGRKVYLYYHTFTNGLFLGVFVFDSLTHMS
jgi:hypothetical protein